MSIRDSLKRLISGTYEEQDVNHIVEICKNFALAYLKMKNKNVSFHYSENEFNSLAYDFIADIFKRDEAGHFINLADYFAGKEIDRLASHKIEIEIRRLVFTKVNDNLFRHMGDQDPSLKKIIRNIKLALNSKKKLQEIVEINDNRIIIKKNSDKSALPELPPEFLEIYLCSSVNQSSQIPEIVIEAVGVLMNQDLYQKEISITQLAISIRNSYVLIQEKNDEEISQQSIRKLMNGELSKFITDSRHQVQSKILPKYIKNDKMQKEDVHKYFSAASKIVQSQFIDNPGSKDSHYEYLVEEFGEVDYKDFRQSYRQRLEYFVKLIRQELVRRYRKDLSKN